MRTVLGHADILKYLTEGIRRQRLSPSLLFVGPEGVGKKRVAHELTALLKCDPVSDFLLVDRPLQASLLKEKPESQTAIKIESVRHLDKFLRLRPADGSYRVAVIDEADRLTEEAANALLKILEGTVASVPPQGGRKHPQQEYIQVDTTHILFICGGAFEGLDQVIQKRVGKQGMGFGAEVKSTDRDTRMDLMKLVQPEDLMGYGLIPELVGRLPVLTTLEPLGQGALVDILTRPKNALVKQFAKMFRLEGVDLEITEPALKEMAAIAIKRGSGARGLRSIIEDLTMDLMYELPEQTNLKKVIIDEAVVRKEKLPVRIYGDADKQSA
jgi:ATP-dependent Clp protease ATP-binding subunit ClpX